MYRTQSMEELSILWQKLDSPDGQFNLKLVILSDDLANRKQ